jgi:hypothetical protein
MEKGFTKRETSTRVYQLATGDKPSPTFSEEKGFIKG